MYELTPDRWVLLIARINPEDLLMDNRKLTSTILLFIVFIGFLWWGLSMLISSLAAPQKDGESIVYSLLILACAGYALVSIILLPRKKQP
jgi:hypothetical protein